jgi:16S rRNA (cytidine1402-2'-O)-methyltransferase
MPGRLFVCATPIGNLEDASARLVRVLGSVDLIAAEDTRRTGKLLSRFGIRTKMLPYHDANEIGQNRRLVTMLQDGKQLAIVSDGGMPAVSDPGYRLVRGCIDANIPVEVIPGPSAILPALVLSGLPTARFSFEGFLPKPAGEKRARLRTIADDDRTLVFFESPNRVPQTLEAALAILGDRRMALARELTKLHEEVIRGPISEVIENLPEPVRGEVVLVIEGSGAGATLDEAIEAAVELTNAGTSKSRAAAEASARFKVPRRSIYEGLLNQFGEGSQPSD